MTNHTIEFCNGTIVGGPDSTPNLYHRTIWELAPYVVTSISSLKHRRRLNQDPTPSRDSGPRRDPRIPTSMQPKDQSSGKNCLLPFFRGYPECEPHRGLLFLRQNPGKGGTPRLRPQPTRTKHRPWWEGVASSTEQDAAAKGEALYSL